MIMETILRSKGYWEVVENGIPIAGENATAEVKKAAEEGNLKGLKARTYLYQAVDRNVIEALINGDTAKGIWDSLKLKHKGSSKVKHAQLQVLKREFEILTMKDDETISDFFTRTVTVSNKIKKHGGTMTETEMVEKILRSMPAKFNYVVCSVIQAHDVTTMSIDELQSTFVVEEQRMKNQKVEKVDEQALKVTTSDSSNRGRGRGAGRGGRGRGRVNKDEIQCYKCKKLGHYQYECPKNEENAYYAGSGVEEEILLMAYSEEGTIQQKRTWFLDSGCNNHMTGA